MINRVQLANFKIAKDINLRVAPLTLLSGLNGSGKSTILQSIGLIQQSYDIGYETIEGLKLLGPLVQLGQGRDVLNQDAMDDFLVIKISENYGQNQLFEWKCNANTDSNQLALLSTIEKPTFVKSQRFQFLQADRIVPKTLYPQPPEAARRNGFLGARGEFTADYIARCKDDVVSSGRMFPRHGLGLTDDLIKKFPTNKLIDQISGWLQHLSPGAKLDSEIIRNTDEVLLSFKYTGMVSKSETNNIRPTNVGFGLTYSLPIIVACLSAQHGALLLLENPEAHLHPQGQAALGLLMAKCVSDGVQIIVETHSDHVLNGIRIAVKKNILPMDKVVLHYFTRNVTVGDCYVQSPAILKNGRITDWPTGFFDQWDKDLNELI